MSTFGRVTVTLPLEMLHDIDRVESNRSRFVAEAVRSELDRRRKEELQRSIENPHPDSAEISEAGFNAWADGLPEENDALFDAGRATPVRWVAGQGWVEGSK